MNHEAKVAKAGNRTYSHYTREALEFFAVLIREERISRKVPAQELAERAGISRGLLQRIEKGDPSCAIGTVFEVASILGLPLFNSDKRGLASKLKEEKDKLALLPKMARKPTRNVDDDF